MEPTAEQREAAKKSYQEFMTEFMDWYEAAHPVRSTELGLHDHDGHMPDRSRDGIQRRIDEQLEWLRRMDEVRGPLLPLDDRVDLQLANFAVRAELLDLEEIRVWSNNPSFYHDVIVAGIESLVVGEFAPVGARARSMVARLEAVPGILQAARDNLRNVPRVWVELGAEDARVTAAYLRGDVPAALAEQSGNGLGRMLQARLDAALERAATAMDEYAGWLERDLLPRASGDFRLGRYIFLRKLLYEEQVDLTANDMARISAGEIQRLRARLEEVAARVDPNRTPREILDSLATTPVAPDSIVPFMEGRLEAARSFAVEHELVTLPTESLPTVRRVAHPRRRAERVALVVPGAFDTTGTSYLELDPALADTTTLDDRHYARLNEEDLTLVAAHHVVPGHFVQKTVVRSHPSRVRRTFQPRSLGEGWAHYAEQLVMDHGYAHDDPVLTLVHVRRALERQARWDAGLHLHAFDETLEQAIDRFQTIALVDAATARSEVLRGTWDPIYLSDALGRLQIVELLKAYNEWMSGTDRQRPESDSVSLRDFHDAFLRMGLPPTLARPVLMPSPPDSTDQEQRRRRRVPVPPPS